MGNQRLQKKNKQQHWFSFYVSTSNQAIGSNVAVNTRFLERIIADNTEGLQEAPV